MNRIRPFIYGSKTDDVPDCYNRVRYIRDSCKVFSDLWKSEKDFMNKSIDNDVSKAFKEFRQSEVARNYRSIDSINPTILNQTIDDFIEIHDQIDSRRKSSAEQIKKLTDQAREKQNSIRQTMNELRENYEKAQKKLETADTNLKRFQSRVDRLTMSNYDEKSREFEDLRCECEQNRTLARDQYSAEIYQLATEEYSISLNLFFQYLSEQKSFYDDISKYFHSKMPQIESRLDQNDFIPLFGLQLEKHCLKRSSEHFIAYPIEICCRLLENHLREEGIFRIASSMSKQKKFVAQLNLQLIDKSTTLNELGFDPHIPANTLKLYLRELPECLLTNRLFQDWNQIISINDEQSRLQRMSQLIRQLPRTHFENLRYLVRFLSRVAQFSSENKMTANNLSICIGGSILFNKDQQQMFNPSATSICNSYTNGSILLELLILHHRYFFPSSSSTTNQQEKSSRTQPDLIPTEFHSKSRTNSNESILESSSHSQLIQPSPSTRRKAKAPPPPPPPPPPSCVVTNVLNPSSKTFVEEENINEDEDEDFDDDDDDDVVVNDGGGGDEDEDHSNSSIETNLLKTKPIPPLTIDQLKTSRNEEINDSSSICNSSVRSYSQTIDRNHRRTASGGVCVDRPLAPPPLPPLINASKQEEQRICNDQLTSNDLNYKEKDDQEERRTSFRSQSNSNSSESVNVGRLISELNHRMSTIGPQGKLKSNENISNRRFSSSSTNNQKTSPGETTDF